MMQVIEDTTVVVTSCGRHDLLRTTLESFYRFNTYPGIRRAVVIEDGLGDPAEVCAEFGVELIRAGERIGQVRCKTIGSSTGPVLSSPARRCSRRIHRRCWSGCGLGMTQMATRSASRQTTGAWVCWLIPSITTGMGSRGTQPFAGCRTTARSGHTTLGATRNIGGALERNTRWQQVSFITGWATAR